MGARDKRERKIRQAPAQVALPDLLALLGREGFECRPGSQGHYTCTHALLAYTVGIPNPHPGSHIKPVYVKAVLRMLDHVRAEKKRLEEEQRP